MKGKLFNMNLISLHVHGCMWNVFFLTANITSLIDLFWNNHKMDGCVLNRTKILKCRLCFIGNHLKEYIWRSCVRFIPCEPHFIRNSSLCMTDKQQSIALMLFSCQNNLNQINSLICVLSKKIHIPYENWTVRNHSDT